MALAEYVLLPLRGLRAAGRSASGRARDYLGSLPVGTRLGRGRTRMEVVDGIGDDGPRLVRAEPEAAAALRAQQPGLRLVPVRWYQPARSRYHLAARIGRADTVSLRVVVRSRLDGSPVPGAEVIAVVDPRRDLGDTGFTDRRGVARLRLPPVTRIARLYVYTDAGYWSLLRRAVPVAAEVACELRPVDLTRLDDGLRHALGRSSPDHGAGVRVGILDTGIDAAHPDLRVVGGRNTVTGEDPTDHGDNGEGHGTHVAGIVAARGAPPGGLAGVAPGAGLYSYRVFGRGGDGASSFAIAKAIDASVQDRCDLLNLSFGGGDVDPVLRAAIEDARAAGTVTVAAAGNDGRQPVGFPASEATTVGVSALGRKGTYPADSPAVLDQARPFGKDRADYVAAFSNVGPQIDVTGPGVAVISTVPGGYGEMSGTSMACPAVVGVAARLLGVDSRLLRARRDAGRSDALISRLLLSATSLGLPVELEGRGLPR
jgi:subtilisin family serine protease